MGGLLMFKQESDSRELFLFLVSFQKRSHNCNFLKTVLSSHISEAHVKYQGSHQVLSTHRWMRCGRWGQREGPFVIQSKQRYCVSHCRGLRACIGRLPYPAFGGPWRLPGQFVLFIFQQVEDWSLTTEAVSLGKKQHEKNDGVWDGEY